MIMEILEEVHGQRCDNNQCNLELIANQAIMFWTPHGDIELCFECVFESAQIASKEAREHYVSTSDETNSQRQAKGHT